MDIRVVEGDITTQRVDAIVTAANSQLLGGAGVNGAVHRAAGPELLRASRALAPCPAGEAVVTPAFDLRPVRWVIHAVGPVYSGPSDAPVLASAYTAALRCADEVGARSVAFYFVVFIAIFLFTIIIFFIVGAITLFQFRYTRMWEEVSENV